MSGLRKTADELARRAGHENIAEVIAGYRDQGMQTIEIKRALLDTFGIVATHNTIRSWETD